MTTPGPTPAASSFYSATPSPSMTALPTSVPTATGAQTVGGNVSGYAAQSAASVSAGQVYMGTTPGTTINVGRSGYLALGDMQTGGPQESYLSTSDAANLYYSWTADQQAAFRAKMALVDSSYATATDAQLAAAWGGANGLVAQAAAYLASGQKVTPWDILTKDIASNNGGRGKALQTVYKNYDQVVHTSAPDANAIFMASAQSLLGRAPTADELTAFRNNLYGLEAANPLHHQEEITYTAQGIPMPVEKGTSGGVSDAAKQMLALQQAKGNKDYGAYQAATTYMNALKQAIGLGG